MKYWLLGLFFFFWLGDGWGSWRTFLRSRPVLHRGGKSRQSLHHRSGQRGAESSSPAGQREGKGKMANVLLTVHRSCNPPKKLIALYAESNRSRVRPCLYTSATYLLRKAAFSPPHVNSFCLSLSLLFSDFGLHSDRGCRRQRVAPPVQHRPDQHWHLWCQRQPAAFLAGKLQSHHPGVRGQWSVWGEWEGGG